MTTSKVKQFTEQLKTTYDHLASDIGVGTKRDRVLLAGMQRAVNLYSADASTMRDEHEFMKPGDTHLYPKDLTLTTEAFGWLIKNWQSQVDTIGLLQKFIEDSTSGVYIIAIDPRTRPVDVKVGRTDKPHGRLADHRRAWRHMDLLDILPLHQTELGTLKAFESNAHVYASGILMPIPGEREKFEADNMGAAHDFARRAREHFIRH